LRNKLNVQIISALLFNNKYLFNDTNVLAFKYAVKAAFRQKDDLLRAETGAVYVFYINEQLRNSGVVGLTVDCK